MSLRQAENFVKIEGILLENDIKYSSFIKEGKNVESIGGTIKVLVEQPNSDTLEIPVHMFATKYTKTGTVNPSYTSIETVMKDFVSVAACGSKEQADKIRITRGEIHMNEYIGQNGNIVSYPRINANFVAKATGEFIPKATFTVEFMVSEMHRMTDKEGIELTPAKLAITSIVPQYGEKIDIVPLVVTNPNAIAAIEQYWEPGCCYKASGRLNFTSKTEKKVMEVDFGEAQEQTYTVTVSEFVVTGGSQAPIEEDFAFATADIEKAIAERKNRLDAMKNNAAKPTKPAGGFDLGF